jgi:tetratricopeptide (TPR) repeat protein
MKPKRNKKIRTFVYFVQLRGELNHASLKPYLPNDPHKSLKCLIFWRRRIMKTRQFTALLVFALVVFGVEQAQAQRTKTDHQIAYYQTLLKRSPQRAKAYLGLGDALVRKARQTGDPSYFNRAEKALRKSLDIAPQNAGALRHLAYVYYSRHEFAPAALYARKAAEMNPQDGDAYGVLGDALLEVGQYLEAQAAYAYMMELDQSLYSYSRLAGLKSVRGDSAGAIADLERAITVGRAAKQPAESIAWAEWQLGMEYFATGDLERAETCFLQSLETYPNYYRALAAMAQLRGAQKRYDEAIELYQKAIAILPMPDYVAALGDIYEKTGQLEQASRQHALVEYIGRLNEINKILYNRELAYFYADHDMRPLEGLELARRELHYRRDIYAYDVVAWSLYKNGELEAARESIHKALKLGTRDARLFFHAGMIHYGLGEFDEAKGFLSRALKTNPYLHILLAEQAARILKEIENGDERVAANLQPKGR